MIHPTVEMLERVTTILTRSQFARLVRVILSLPTHAERDFVRTVPLTPRTQLKVYVYEWLVHLGFMAEDRIRWVLTQLDAELNRLGVWIEREYPKLVAGPPLLVVADRRYVRMREDWLDVEAEAPLREERLLVTHISVDLSALFHQKQQMLRKLYPEGTDAEPTDDRPDRPAGAGPATADRG